MTTSISFPSDNIFVFLSVISVFDISFPIPLSMVLLFSLWNMELWNMELHVSQNPFLDWVWPFSSWHFLPFHRLGSFYLLYIFRLSEPSIEFMVLLFWDIGTPPLVKQVNVYLFPSCHYSVLPNLSFFIWNAPPCPALSLLSPHFFKTINLLYCRLLYSAS